MRILPILILVSVALFSVKLGHIWQGISQGDAIPIGQALAAGKEGGPSDTATPGKDDAALPASVAGAPGSPQADEAKDAGADGGPEEDPRQFTLSEVRLLQALSKRRKILETRERELAQRQALLKAAEQQLVSRRAEMLDIKRQLERLLKLVDKKEINRINNLVKIYENMKPRDAAVIFNGLEHGVLLEVVERMKVRKAAPVIAAMEPNRARRLTQSLAVRRNVAKSRAGQRVGR